jgi:hypothetical protein
MLSQFGAILDKNNPAQIIQNHNRMILSIFNYFIYENSGVKTKLRSAVPLFDVFGLSFF